MRVLVTGAAGLYGVHLVDELVKMEEVSRVFGIDDFSREYFQQDPFIKSPQFKRKFQLSVRNFYTLTPRELDEMNLDALIHLAAYVSIPDSMRKQYQYFRNNEYGTFRLVQSLLKTKNWPQLIYASTPEVYGSPLYIPIDTNHPLLPRSVYAVTKLAAEKHCRAMYEWYKYPVVVIRNFNTYGENQDISPHAGVISRFILMALKGSPLLVHNTGEQTRDFQYIKDAVHAYALILREGKRMVGEIFNIGTGVQTSIRELAERILEITGSKSAVKFRPGRCADLMSLEADCSAIKEKLGWAPQCSLEEGLRRTVHWYRRFVG
ncbi:MAG: GDP-mannose 4,6-dehydratase [Dehalococcoidia bacterium]